MMHPFGPNDDKRVDELIEEYGKAYAEFVTEQLAKHINPSKEPFYGNAVLIVLQHTIATVAGSLASAVWSAEQAAKITKSGDN